MRQSRRRSAVGWRGDAVHPDDRDRVREVVATSLGITAPTFHQHLRKAEASVLEKLLCEVALSESAARSRP